MCSPTRWHSDPSVYGKEALARKGHGAISATVLGDCFIPEAAIEQLASQHITLSRPACQLPEASRRYVREPRARLRRCRLPSYMQEQRKDATGQCPSAAKLARLKSASLDRVQPYCAPNLPLRTRRGATSFSIRRAGSPRSSRKSAPCFAIRQGGPGCVLLNKLQTTGKHPRHASSWQRMLRARRVRPLVASTRQFRATQSPLPQTSLGPSHGCALSRSRSYKRARLTPPLLVYRPHRAASASGRSKSPFLRARFLCR